MHAQHMDIILIFARTRDVGLCRPCLHEKKTDMEQFGKILIVDDNEDVLFALNLLLEPYAEKIKVAVTPDRILQIDRTQIEQVLINLIKNAKEACSRKEHPRIEVKMLPALSWQCLITVSDNGEGILPEVQDKIFVPFFTTKPSGSGIGLSLCKQVMNRHGGNITVQSTVGKGSCFTLLFG